jgi:MFS superfamily sulfate permease-like transporter
MLELISMLEAGSKMLYIDPAATSVLLTSITAIVVAVGASAIIFWRKVKKKVSKTLHIDPNAGKEVEDELVINDEEINSEIEEAEKAEEVQEPAEEETKEEK